jgi:hypothetical protein
MNRTESDYCNEQAQRMLTLAKESADPDIRLHLTTMAKNWKRRTMGNENEKPRSTAQQKVLT